MRWGWLSALGGGPAFCGSSPGAASRPRHKVADTDRARLDPQARAVIESAARAPGPVPGSLGVAEARRLYRETRLRLPPPPPAGRGARHFFLPGPARGTRG